WDVVVDETKNEVYVSNYASNSVWVYDANTMAVKQQISTADKPALMDYLPKLDALAVVVRGINGVAIIDTVSYKVMQYLGVGGKGVYGIAADPVNNHLVVTN